jgi:peptidoglycan hydrolase-like protein with peptidoglycan-binding domain
MADELQSSCVVTVHNTTNASLNLLEQGHDRGDFKTFPAPVVAPGASNSFEFVEELSTFGGGCIGNLIYEVGQPAVATWRIDWENRRNGSNEGKGALSGDEAGNFRSLEQAGAGDLDVPFAFTISGQSSSVTPEPAFEPPVEQTQPTLRLNDQSADGWVEYLQELLNHQFGEQRVSVSGTFDGTTHQAVLDFQQREQLMRDGVVGNQTWAALREATPQPPSTDGRAPHTFDERGAEARWATENNDFVAHNEGNDELLIMAISVGDTPLPSEAKATVRLTSAIAQHVTENVIEPPVSPGAGAIHFVRVPNVKATFGAGQLTVEAFLPAELGGDQIQTSITLN